MAEEGKVALITGGNAGIGLTLAERLLSTHVGLRICLACRNKAKAESARDALQLSHPEADVSIVIVDVGNISSVIAAAKEIKSRYQRLDYLFLNAGIFPVSRVKFEVFFKGLFQWKNLVYAFTTGHGALQQVDEQTSEGLSQVFTTNLFGHYVLIREVEDCLGGEHTTQIVWTSSINALREAFSLENIQHKNGPEPYSSSKYATDVLSVALNEEMNKKGVYSHSTCPGLVMTNITYGIMPSWVWVVLTPLFWLFRLVVPSMNFSPFNGSEALLWLTHQQPEGLDPMVKYQSQTTLTGKRHVGQVKMKVDPVEAKQLSEQLDELYQTFKHKNYSYG